MPSSPAQKRTRQPATQLQHQKRDRLACEWQDDKGLKGHRIKCRYDMACSMQLGAFGERMAVSDETRRSSIVRNGESREAIAIRVKDYASCM